MLTKFRFNFGFFSFLKNFNNTKSTTPVEKTTKTKDEEWDSKNWS
jgi:hypothetical protein